MSSSNEESRAAAFHRAMVDATEEMKREIGYTPTRFLQVIGNAGGVEAAKQLLRQQGSSEGFTKLWESGRLDLSAEAHILLPWFTSLASDDELETARRRLEDHGFDVDAFLTSRSREWPTWARRLRDGQA